MNYIKDFLNNNESITIADFPMDTTWLDDNVESQCEKILDITHKILSNLTQFNLKVKPNIAIFTEDDVLR